MSTGDAASKRQAAREVIDILHDISSILETGLDRTQLSLCVSLLENGVSPDALATIVKDLRTDDGGEATGAGAATHT